MLTTENVKTLISKSLGLEIDSLLEIHEIRDRAGREIIDCLNRVGSEAEKCILKVYHKDCDDDSELGVFKLAKKTHLASRNLAVYSIKIPKVFGSYMSNDFSCVVMERLQQTHWEPGTRVEAAGILARLHSISLETLSDELQGLIRDSKPNRDRGRLGVIGRSKYLDKKYPQWRGRHLRLSKSVDRIIKSVEPVSSMTTLVHGDYFSVNLISTADGLYVIDWDLLALGDPMWDLGFLVGADEGLTEKESEEVIQAYRQTRPIDADVLHWQMECWRTLRGLIKLMDEYRNL